MTEGTKNSLLIVDDENSNMKVLSHILGSEYTIYAASNGESAIEKAKEVKPDLILLDIIMPGMDGYQTLSRIKKCKELEKTPVIFITGLNSDEHEEKALSLEAADYITKPFSAPIVKLRVRNQIQLKNAVKAAEAASHYKSAFLAKMSHEIRTPLNAILGISLIQLQQDTYPSEAMEAFTRIFNAGDLLLSIVNDILDMSKIEAGKLAFTQAQYDVVSMINDTVFINMIKNKNKPVEFILNVDEKLPSLLVGDEVRIQQILNNLLSNAFKYTVSGKVEMSVSVEDSPDKSDKSCVIVFRVRDTGQGMTEEQVKRLFDENYHVNLEARKSIEGTGLGMGIVKNLTGLMNGDITVESKLGEGSLFTVRIPQGVVGTSVLGKEKAQEMGHFRLNYEKRTQKTQIDRKQIPDARVLVVDDVDINLYVAEEMLSPYGLKVDFAVSGIEAIEKVQERKYDLVFMDHIMPIMNGVETVKKIRSLGKEFEKLPIIALTANAIAGVKEMFLENGFNGFIPKPIGLHELDEVLKEWI